MRCLFVTVVQTCALPLCRPLSLDEFMAGDYEEGYQYELIDRSEERRVGKECRSRIPERWIKKNLALYAREHREVINYVSHKARVFVPGRPRVTNPEPDVA